MKCGMTGLYRENIGHKYFSKNGKNGEKKSIFDSPTVCAVLCYARLALNKCKIFRTFCGSQQVNSI